MGLSYLTLKLTNSCNMNRYMCGQKYSNNRNNGEEIKLEQIIHILNTNKNIKTVYLFGGEPLLYSKIIELLKELYNRNIDVLISTNGILLEKYAKELVDYNVLNISISIDTYNKKDFAKIRGKDSLWTVMRNIVTVINYRNIKGKTYPKIGTNSVILKENQNNLIKLYYFIIGNIPDIDRINIESPIMFNKEIIDKQKNYLRENFNISETTCVNFYEKLETLDNSIFNQLMILKNMPKTTFQCPTKYDDFVNTFTESFKIPTKKCFYPYNAACILPNGDVTFCIDFPDYILGNIYKNDLNEIFSGLNASKFRETIENKGYMPICSRCPHRFDYDEFYI